MLDVLAMMVMMINDLSWNIKVLYTPNFSGYINTYLLVLKIRRLILKMIATACAKISVKAQSGHECNHIT